MMEKQLDTDELETGETTHIQKPDATIRIK